jgi:hypothetical protein
MRYLAARRPVIIACLVLVALLGTSAAPVHGAWDGRYSIWHKRAFATQYTDYSCVGATIQIMLNLIHDRADRSRRRQFEYLDYAQQQSRYPITDLGADPEGWARAMVHYGGGRDYGWSTDLTIQAALYTAARQMRQTGKPVGLLVHFGRHAWVMTGFESDRDPGQTDDFTVTAAEVVGPLWPHGTLNGRSFDPGPRTWMNVRTLSRRFDAYAEPGQPLWSGQYVTILPRASQVQKPEQPGNGGRSNQDLPDLNSPFGWIWVFRQLSLKLAVRDLLWLN